MIDAGRQAVERCRTLLPAETPSVRTLCEVQHPAAFILDSASAVKADLIAVGTRDHSRAAACFELGIAAERRSDHAAAVTWWKQAHALFPENWTYKRQAWTLESTPDGADSDRAQEVQESYGTSWSDEFLATGGANATAMPKL